MAKRYGTGNIVLKGFDEYIQALTDAGKSIDKEGKQCFLECTKEVSTALLKYSTKAGLPSKLKKSIKSETVLNDNAGVWYYETGWQKGKPNYKKLSDAYKVLFYNYGTPRRTTKKGQNRGQEKATYFISNAKRSAARSCKKIQKNFLADITKGL